MWEGGRILPMSVFNLQVLIQKHFIFPVPISVFPYTHVFPWSLVSWQFGEICFPQIAARHQEENKSWVLSESNKHTRLPESNSPILEVEDSV